MRKLAVLLVVLAVSGVASAEITMRIESNPVPLTEMAGYIYNDVIINTDSDWMSAVLIVRPESPEMASMIYQDAVGGILSPLPAFFPTFPTLEYDTYVSNGVLGEPVSVAAAVDQGFTEVEFTTDTGHENIALLFYTTDTDDIGELTLARVTMLGGSGFQGTWQFIATADPAGGPVVIAEGPVENGVMVPEPATLALLGLGGLALIRRRRR